MNQTESFPQQTKNLLLLILAIAVLMAIHTHVVPAFTCGIRQEGQTLGFVKNLCSAQTLFKEYNYVNKDQDENAEFGYISELLGVPPLRNPNLANDPPCLGVKLDKQISPVHIQAYGYNIIVFLPTGILGKNFVDMDEKYWFGFAWPQNIKKNKIFFIFNQECDIFCTKNENYDGREICRNIIYILEDEKNWNMENVLKLLPGDLQWSSECY